MDNDMGAKWFRARNSCPSLHGPATETPRSSLTENRYGRQAGSMVAYVQFRGRDIPCDVLSVQRRSRDAVKTDTELTFMPIVAIATRQFVIDDPYHLTHIDFV